MFSGYSKSGKDEACKAIEQIYNVIPIGMTDPARRSFMEIYGWDENQMYGSPEFRNSGDPNLPKEKFKKLFSLGIIKNNPDLSDQNQDFFQNLKKHMQEFPCSNTDREFLYIPKDSHIFKWDHGPDFSINKKYFVEASDCWVTSTNNPELFLSPREALQVHCETMNTLFEPTWVKSVFNNINNILKLNAAGHSVSYSRVDGIVQSRTSNPNGLIFVLNDLRHWHEMRYADSLNLPDFKITKIRVKRPSVPTPPFDHRSETEQASIPDSEFNFVIDNNATLEDFYNVVQNIARFVIDL